MVYVSWCVVLVGGKGESISEKQKGSKYKKGGEKRRWNAPMGGKGRRRKRRRRRNARREERIDSAQRVREREQEGKSGEVCGARDGSGMASR